MDICNKAVKSVHQFCLQITGEDTSELLDAGKGKDTNLYICMIQLDHMRDKRNYVKTLERWNKDLDITGTIIFCGKGKIYLILIGGERSIKSFQQRLKSNNVDIDSRGRACKEKLSKVLCCDPFQCVLSERTYDRENFGTTHDGKVRLFELQDTTSLKKCFCDMQLEFLYTKYIHSER